MESFTMINNFYLVVGDDYAAFANNDHVMTVSELIRELDASDNWSGEEQFVIGQGISNNTREMLKHALNANGISNVDHLNHLVETHMTHKKELENVLISEPCKINNNQYQFELMLNDKKDRLSDHVTNQHVGAMLLMEAARQAVIVSLEYEFPKEDGNKYGLILERFDSKFDSYVFPLPTQMIVRLEEQAEQSKKQKFIILTITFFQAGNKICKMQLDVKKYESSPLKKLESRRARQVVDLLRMQYIDNPVEIASSSLHRLA